MVYNTYFQITSLLYIILLLATYYSKPRLKSFENTIFISIAKLNFIGLILDIVSVITIIYSDQIPIINFLITKLYLVYLAMFIVLMTVYVISISKSQFSKNTTFIKQAILIIFNLLIVIIFLLPLKYYNTDGIIYSYGIAADFVYLISGICIAIWVYIMLKNFNTITKRKCLPFFGFIVIGSIVIFIQYNNPGLLLMTSMESFITFLMYFTIENPDVKMINELNIAKDQAVKANAAKTDFLSSMSHEIRTPLNAIVGFSQSLKEENLPSSAVEEVQDIIDASDTLLDIVNGILDISKIEANKVEIVNSNYSFKKIFNELVALSKARLGESKPIDFRHKMDETIPETLYGDYARVKQVTLNLLTNAIKYTDEGYIDFKVNSMISGDVCRLIISVEDSGRGIKKESINKLFTKFERLDEKNTTIEGTGLGLAITKKLVELMNGKIIVQSIYGKGSRFTIVVDQKVVTEPVNTPVVEVDNESLITHDLSKKKVLIVDDNQLNLKVAARMLKPFNVISETIDSGLKCIDLIASGNTYDLIFMDDMMPKLNGTDTLHRLKENETFKIPVVALTANAISGMKEKYLAAGFDDYLAKPIEKIELTQIIKKYLDK